jgi:hypothetical protein
LALIANLVLNPTTIPSGAGRHISTLEKQYKNKYVKQRPPKRLLYLLGNIIYIMHTYYLFKSYCSGQGASLVKVDDIAEHRWLAMLMNGKCRTDIS